MFVHLIYAAIYSVLVVSLLISYDLFIKNFKELNLRLSFKKFLSVSFCNSQVYFIISFSLNSIGYVAYRIYDSNLYLLFWYSQREKIYLIGLVPVILLTFFALINKFEWGAILFIIGLNYIILIITCLLKKRFYGQTNHTVFYLFSILVTVISPMVNAFLFYRREISLWDAVTLGIGSVGIVSLWKYYLQNQKNFPRKNQYENH